MCLIAHISDLHFGRARPGATGALLRALRLSVPDLVVVTGDLTQRARRREFAAAQEFLARLPATALVVPGNHDLPLWRPMARFARPWGRWRRYISADQIPVVRGPGCVAVGVNTARRWGSWIDWSRGRINRAQLEAVAAAFADTAPETLRILAAHHPFLLLPGGLRHRPVGRASLGLARLIESRVDLILGGHVHRAYAGVARAPGPVVVQAASAVSDRLRGEPNGFNRIRLQPATLTVEVLQWQHGEFAVQRSHVFRRAGSGWVAA
jgi:3',5'-cyclic AMP phosphodiesterase CpdA